MCCTKSRSIRHNSQILKSQHDVECCFFLHRHFHNSYSVWTNIVLHQLTSSCRKQNLKATKHSIRIQCPRAIRGQAWRDKERKTCADVGKRMQTGIACVTVGMCVCCNCSEICPSQSSLLQCFRSIIDRPIKNDNKTQSHLPSDIDGETHKLCSCHKTSTFAQTAHKASPFKQQLLAEYSQKFKNDIWQFSNIAQSNQTKRAFVYLIPRVQRYGLKSHNYFFQRRWIFSTMCVPACVFDEQVQSKCCSGYMANAYINI